MTKVGLDIIGTSTTLESNKSLLQMAISWSPVGREGSRRLIRVRGRTQGGPMTLGEQLLVAIIVLLLMACGMLWYGVRLLQESVKTQRRLVRMWLTIHRPA